MDEKGRRTNPYAIIAEFWGDELDEGLLGRIIEAPEDHIGAFRDHYYQGSEVRELPPLPFGHLRPILKESPIDHIFNARPEVSISRFASIALLYSHELVMDDLGVYLAIGDRVTQHSIGRWLIEVKPLFDDGSLHFKPVSSMGKHPAWQTVRDFSETIAQLTLPGDESYLAYLQQWLPLDGGTESEQLDFYRGIISVFLSDLNSFTVFSRIWNNQVNRLLRTEAERRLLEIVLKGQPKIEGRNLTLLKLMSLSVPRFSPDIRALVSVRRSEAAFADLRRDLANALSRIDVQALLDSDSISEARQELAEELEPSRLRMETATAKSPALTTLRTGLAGFGISSVAAAAGFVTGGSLLSALASAAATKAVDGAVKYHQLLMERRRGRALSDLVVSLTSPTDEPGPYEGS